MAGNGTIGLELAEDLPDADAVVVPWGGGGLFTGIASALKALRPETQDATRCSRRRAPRSSAALDAGEPREADSRPRGSTAPARRSCCPAMWERARPLLAGASSSRSNEAADAVRLLAERVRVIAEGAGALAFAAALSGDVPGGKLVCIVSGGNIDAGAARVDPARRDARLLVLRLPHERQHEPDDREQARPTSAVIDGRDVRRGRAGR